MSQNLTSELSTPHSHTVICGSLTNDLEASVRVKLANVTSTEPSLAVLIHKKVLTIVAFFFVVAHRYIGPTNQNLSSWVGLICAVVTT